MTLPVRRKLLFTVAVIALALAVTAPALAGNGGFAPVPPESPNAEGITQSYWFVSAFVLAIFVLVEGLLVAFVIRYRRKRRPRDADGVQIHGSNRLELSWTIGPVVILFVIAVFVLVKLPGIADVPGATAGRRAARDRGGRAAVRLAISLPERRHRDRPSARAGRPPGTARGHRARLGRGPLVVDPRARRQDRRHPRPDDVDLVRGGQRPGRTRVSAPSCAACTTPRCWPGSR